MRARPLRIGSLCSGYGGLDMAVCDVLDAEVAWHAEVDPGATAILAHHWPAVPNLGDISAVDWSQVEPVDILTAGFPCQDLSYAGRGAGIKEGTRSGLWYAVAAAVHALRPRLVVLENVRAITTRRPGLDVVLASLADLGFDAEWRCVRASDVGAPHERWRWFLLAWPANTTRLGREWAGPARDRRTGPADRGHAPAHADSLVPGHHGELPAGRHPVQQRVRDDTPRCGTAPPADTNPSRRETHQPNADWGRFAPAIARWESVLDRCAPWATDDHARLNPSFVEWLMGLPEGHVMGVPGLTRTAQLHALGKGVVPAQAAAALRFLLDRAALAA